MSVGFVDLAAQHREIADEVEPKVLDILRRGAFVGGPAVQAFEESFAEYCGVRHCVGVANGTDALELALRAVGVRPGGEVIMPANTFIATAEAASRIGAIPVPVDVDDDFLLLDPTRVEAAITERTQAIVPVHLYGQVAPVEQLTDLAAAHGLSIVEDAAQSQGARRFGRPAGSLGTIAATSFYPGKNLGASGDGGAVLTDDDELARQVRVMGAHGSAVRYVHEVVGVNSRLDAIHAVTLSAKLKRLDAWNAARRAAADRYATLLADIPGVRVPRTMAGNTDVWHLYVIRVPDRDAALAKLLEAGIGAALHYPTPWHLTDAYAHPGYPAGTAPVAEKAAGEILSLPMHQSLTADQQEVVADALRRAT